jgi:bifunctional UDP-N-acetylglucosamine pyrophosphorylase/glucosamine-1-phosphate N-acetyltransferase
MSRPDTVVILAAGQGTRMRTGWAKVLAPLCGRPLIAWVVEAALALDPARVLVVVGYKAGDVEKAVAGLDPTGRVRCVLQEPQNGTGHALQVCLPELGSDPGTTLVLYGDMPLLETVSLAALCAARAEAGCDAALLTAFVESPRGFGRVLRAADGSFERIVEERDASPEERAIDEVNLGVYAFAGKALVRELPRLTNANAQGEYYLTDVVGALVAAGRPVATGTLADEVEAIGVNTLAHLAEARAAMQDRLLEAHLAAGVYIEDPASTFIDHGVSIGPRTRILPCTVIRSGVTIGSDCEVGPFTHLRTGTVLEDGAEIGNFTEAKQTRLGAHAKAKHLSYLGDARIGARANIGAGTIFANYDGRTKRTSVVEDGSFVGSGTILVAPCEVGRGATTGAGAVVVKDTRIPPGETWVGVPARSLARRDKATEGS